MKILISLSLLLTTITLLAEKARVSGSPDVDPFQLQQAHLETICKRNNTSPVMLEIEPVADGCTDQVCPTNNPCCNACSGSWKVKNSMVSATGKALPVCTPDGCGKFDSCKSKQAKGKLLNCPNYYNLKFEVESIK